MQNNPIHSGNPDRDGIPALATVTIDGGIVFIDLQKEPLQYWFDSFCGHIGNYLAILLSNHADHTKQAGKSQQAPVLNLNVYPIFASSYHDTECEVMQWFQNI